jgi:mannose-6-phosphate isomerase-like protein (cupin superfamily)
MNRIPRDVPVYNPALQTYLICLKHAIDTDGVYAQYEFRIKPCAGRPRYPPHFHPNYHEKIEIVEGTAFCICDGEIIKVQAGEVIDLPPGTPHVHPWNDDDTELKIIQTTSSAIPDAEGIDTTMHGFVALAYLARRGQTNQHSIPTNPFQVAAILEATLPNTYSTGIPMPVQNFAIRLMAGVGRLLGYKAFPDDLTA